MINFALVRKLIEKGFTDTEINDIIGGSQPTVASPDPVPEAAPAAAAPEAPEQVNSNGNDDLIHAINSLENTIRASNLIGSVIDVASKPKSVDDVLAEMISPKNSK